MIRLLLAWLLIGLWYTAIFDILDGWPAYVVAATGSIVTTAVCMGSAPLSKEEENRNADPR